MNRDHHSKPFDEGTLTKLALYRAYLKEWLPTFLGEKTPHINRVNIFDFFAGPGQDVGGHKGSPLIALEEIESQKELLAKRGITAFLYLNEYRHAKKRLLDSWVVNIPPQSHVSIQTASLDFLEAFEQQLPIMEAQGSANFVFLDQSGIKQITPEVFHRITRIKTTDFMFFVSSSTLHRFRKEPEITRYLKLPPGLIESKNYYEIHRLLVDFYCDLVPDGMGIHLAGFSIKKGSNIYGLIFGSRHIRGIEKFLQAAWTLDPIRGEANFDIDQERIGTGQPWLIEEMNTPSKKTLFEEELSEKVLTGQLDTNRSVFLFSLEGGFLPTRHAKDCLKRLMKENRLPKQSIPLSYKEAWKKDPIRIILKSDDYG